MVLQSIRERLTGILAFSILGILVVPFALVGVNQYFTNNSVNLVATVNDTEISTSDFNQSFSDYRRRMQSLLGAAFDPDEFDQLKARRQHLDNLIDQELITQAAKSMGLDVDNDTLSEKIRAIPAFQVDGQFNIDVYQSRLASQGLSAKQFENQMRTQIIVSQLPRSISASSLATDAEVNRFAALRDQSRTFSAVMVPAQAPADSAGFSTEELTDWYQSHRADYQSEEQVVIQYVELDSSKMPVGKAPDEDYLREQFNNQKARFITPEQRQVSHILIAVSPDADEATKETARQTAADLARRARAGEDFAELARQYSQDQGSASKGGDLGWVEPGVMVKAFENAMYDLSLEAPISDPVQTGFGWHVIKLSDIRKSTGMSFAEARPILVREYNEDQAARAFLEQADRLVDLVYEDPTTLEAAALEMGLQIQEAGPFGRGGGEGIAANSEVVKTAFSDLVLLQGSVSDPVNLDEDHLVMIKLKEHLPVAVKPFDSVRDEIEATLKDNRARKNAKDQADALLATARSGDTSLEALAEEAALEFTHQDAIKRNSSEPDVLLVKEIFRLQKPDNTPLKVVLPTSTGYALVELEAVTDGVIDSNTLPLKRQYFRVLSNSYASEEIPALLRQLRAAADVEVFEDNIK